METMGISSNIIACAFYFFFADEFSEPTYMVNKFGGDRS